jgi:hypothetical protein
MHEQQKSQVRLAAYMKLMPGIPLGSFDRTYLATVCSCGNHADAFQGRQLSPYFPGAVPGSGSEQLS